MVWTTKAARAFALITKQALRDAVPHAVNFFADIVARLAHRAEVALHTKPPIKICSC